MKTINKNTMEIGAKIKIIDSRTFSGIGYIGVRGTITGYDNKRNIYMIRSDNGYYFGAYADEITRI